MIGTHQLLHSSASIEWYTPAAYIEAARRVLGGIDLDPASCELANTTVKAAALFTAADNGLAQPWCGRVWLNPPYGRINGKSGQQLFSQKLLSEYAAGRVASAIMLVNASTDCRWWRPLWQYTICFTDHRIKFVSPTNGKAKQPTHGSAFIYLGHAPETFIDAFSVFGHVVQAAVKASALR